MRIILFLLTNIAVLVVFNIILSLLGVDSQSVMGLLVFAFLFGFSGSIISLLLSKFLAKRSVGAQVITNPRNASEAWLLNTVRDQAQKAGIGMPEVAIYNSNDINAFATGASRNNSLVAVSSALLNSMTRDEAEAVLAHEVSHIKNGDMVTMTLLQGVVNTFVIFLSRIIAKVAATDKDGDTNHFIYFIVSMVLEIIFGVLASIITMYFSRVREFKADAGSASLVGKEKMIAALRRLGQAQPSDTINAEFNALCINGAKSKFGGLFLSHPPLEDRIKALQKL